jgi:nucleoside-diphosphate-sugar epimerase
MDKDLPKLLITGINGYIGSWVTLKALECGQYKVRGTVRDKTNKKKLQPLRDALGDKFDELELFEANLTDKDSLKKAVEGCEFVLHLASPFPAESPKNEDEVIQPAVEGTIGIMEACVGSDVKRIVTTSSCAAILDYSDGNIDVDETHWPAITRTTAPYVKSKILAEKAAWEFIENLKEEEKTFEFSTVNPGLVVGPLLVKAEGASQKYISNLLTGQFPSVPKIYLPLVDVRDVADAHILALAAKPFERYALNERTILFPKIGEIINEEFKSKGYKKVSHKSMCKSTAWMAKFFSKDVKSFYADWNIKCHVKNDKAKETLGLKFRNTEDSIIEMCYSMIEHGLVPNKLKK